MTARHKKSDSAMPRSAIIARVFVAISSVLFLISLTQDGFTIDRADNPRAWSSCIGLLVVGWIAVFDGVWAWLANPFLAITWILLLFSRQRWITFGLGIASLGLALSFLANQQILSDESGNHSRIISYEPGYWCWIASIVVAIFGSVASGSTAVSTQAAEPGIES